MPNVNFNHISTFFSIVKHFQYFHCSIHALYSNMITVLLFVLLYVALKIVAIITKLEAPTYNFCLVNNCGIPVV